MKKIFILFAGIALVLAFGISSSEARNSYLSDVNSTCGTSEGCGLCHVDTKGGGPLTTEGEDYVASGYDACTFCPTAEACTAPPPPPPGGTCTDFTSKETCNAEPGCAWSGSPKNGSCAEDTGGGTPPPPVCTDYTTSDTCNADSACIWTGNEKKGSCGDKPIGSVNMIFTQGTFGEYCTDPKSWISAGYQVGIWPTNVGFKAQAVDANGYKVDTAFEWSCNGQTGTMAVANASNNVYSAAPYVPDGVAYSYTVTAGGKSQNGTLYRDPAACDSCHPTPPGHIANPNTWGNCRGCHNLGEKIHTHAVTRANISDTDCYACHPTGCYNNDAHNAGSIGIWCTDCHGVLSDVLKGTFKITHQAGKPKCADCHDRLHSEKSALYTDDVKHGGMLCASCHGAPHRVQKPTIKCVDCHTTQASDPKMGSDCGSCHKSSIDPHLVTRAK